MVVLPALAVVVGVYWWLTSGRYVSTDNAYIGADKVMITPQVTGAIKEIDVIEGQHVKAGQRLFEIDPEPYRYAVTIAQGKLEAAKQQYQNQQLSYKSNEEQIALSKEAVRLRQSDYDRKTALSTRNFATQVDLMNTQAALVQARQVLALVEQLQEAALLQLGGKPDAPLEQFAAYIQAKGQLEDAQRNLRQTEVLAPIDGVATQVPQIQMGRVFAAGSPVFAVIADRGLWIDANPKETDLTYVRRGQPVSIAVDTYPDRTYRGVVASISPGTGAEFAILPPQNANGNWVKVVQRVPLRVEFAPDEDTTGLRAGLSTVVTIDTGRQRSLGQFWAGLVGLKDDLLGSAIPKSKASP
jgi:membrane fusion protein, multidrug efflux system